MYVLQTWACNATRTLNIEFITTWSDCCSYKFKLNLLSMRVFHTESMPTIKACVALGNLCCRYTGGPGLVKLSLRFGHLLALRYVASVDLRKGGAAQFLPIS